jgi:predicted  nucleic acid-binding Zn-ribbon protein
MTGSEAVNDKDIETKFAHVEKRVQTLVSENKGLTGRVRELEQELAQARREAQELQNFHGKRMHIKEKIERILQSMEAVKEKE